MSLTHNMRKVSLFICCAIGIATMSGQSVALAVTARDALCAAELITAGCRVTTLVANKLDAAGNANARTVTAVAHAVQAANELLALINSWDDVPRAIGYSGSWLVYDLYRFTQQIGGGSKVAIDGKEGVINGATAADDFVAESTSAPWLSDEFCDSLQRDLLPAIETVTAVAAAYVGWQGTAEQRVWRNRLQSLLSLSRIIRVCLERRHEPDMKYYAAVATAHALLTIAEFSPLLRAEAKQPVIVVPDVQGGGPAVQQLVQAAQRRQQRAQALIDAAERQLREQPGNSSARFNLREAQDLFETNQSELAVVQTISPTTVGNIAEEIARRTHRGALLERGLSHEERASVERIEHFRLQPATGRLNQEGVAHQALTSQERLENAKHRLQEAQAQAQDDRSRALQQPSDPFARMTAQVAQMSVQVADMTLQEVQHNQRMAHTPDPTLGTIPIGGPLVAPAPAQVHLSDAQTQAEFQERNARLVRESDRINAGTVHSTNSVHIVQNGHDVVNRREVWENGRLVETGAASGTEAASDQGSAFLFGGC